MKILLSVAGFDPTSGAGITKDIEIFLSLGFHGIGIPTSIVDQGPSGVRSLYPIPISAFEKMLKTLEEEGIEVEGLKTGVLVNEDYIKSLVSYLSQKRWNKPIVVDPVIRAKNKYPLLDEGGISALKGSLIAKSTFFLPNKEEAEILTNLKLESIEDMVECAKKLKEMGAENVVIKGFCENGEIVDLFFDGKTLLERRKSKVSSELHGTGCMYSSILLCFLALGFKAKEAFIETENLIDLLFREAYSVAKEGYLYSSLSIYKGKLGERFEVLSALKELKEKLQKLNPVELIPEVQMNVCYAVSDAKGIEDVCAYPGRISKYGDRVLIKADPEFGASSHVARALLAFMKFYPHIKSCANLKYAPEFIERAKKNGLKTVFFDRRKEPQMIKEKEGKSLDFLVESALKEIDYVPDLIYDDGDLGREPMIRLFARDPFELLEKMERILR